MISNREIKGQIDELTEQNQFLTQELQQIKELLQSQSKNQSQDQNQGQKQGQKQGEDQGQDPESQQGQQAQDQGPDSGQANQKSSQSMDSSGQQGKGSNNSNQIFDIANDFLKLKELTGSLEKKMQKFTSGKSSGGSLTDEDIINLILSMMNGMIDWTMDFASKPKQGNQQSRLQ